MGRIVLVLFGVAAIVFGQSMAAIQGQVTDPSPDTNRPTLRRAPGSGPAGNNGDTKTDDNDRPTLKRRPDSGS